MDTIPYLIHPDTFASSPGRVYLQRLTWLRHYPARPIFHALLVAASVGSIWYSWWCLLLIPIFAYWNNRYWLGMRAHFYLGDCNPGFVLQVNPLRVAIATDLLRDPRCSFPVLKIVQYPFQLRGSMAPRVGDFIPTVAFYRAGSDKAAPFWNDFDPIPVHCATADADVIADAARIYPWRLTTNLENLLTRTESLEPGLYWFDPETLSPMPHPTVLLAMAKERAAEPNIEACAPPRR